MYSKGKILLFMNNDIEIIEPGWLTKIVSRFEYDGVGAVGVKLLYRNNKIQHAGVALGIYEVAGHIMRHQGRYSSKNNNLVNLERKVSAVTAACMAVSKEVFQLAGGFDEENLPVSYNDIDLCLKIGNLGYDIIYSPSVELYHLESQSRGIDLTNEQKELSYKERRFMLLKYGALLRNDPYYNPNLSLTSEGMIVSDNPRVRKIWCDTVFFILPANLKEALVGFQIANSVTDDGFSVCMYAPIEIKSVIDYFKINENVSIVFTELNLKDKKNYYESIITNYCLNECYGSIVFGSPQRDIEKTSMNYVENYLFNFGINIDRKIKCSEVQMRNETDYSSLDSFDLSSVVLLYPGEGNDVDIIPPLLIDDIIGICHTLGLSVVQVGSNDDKKIEKVDSCVKIDNNDLNGLVRLIKKSRALISVDSWVSVIGEIMGTNLMVLFGSSRSKYWNLKNHFTNQCGSYIAFDSVCPESPCHSNRCLLGFKTCSKMSINKQDVIDFLVNCISNNS